MERETGNKSIVRVFPRRREELRSLLKRFRRLCEKEGIVRDQKRKSYYEKPSDERRRRHRKSIRRIQKELAEAEDNKNAKRPKSDD